MVKKSQFGASVREILTDRQITQSELARSIEKNPAYVNHTMTGYRKASPEWVELVASVLKLNERERKRLHAAAARDAGFEIDLE